ncbi:MAG: sigma-70 family RNA polymerase sigma factor [Deltaproteobacteria bacterium]|nr:MAG: sigma-70 family RNA polymerase sigma factor [Deltaproteobacteria bacterium]
MNRSLEEDRQILAGCLSGNRKASETLVRRFSDLVYRSVQYTLMSRNVPFNKHDLEDLHNTVFLRLFERRCKKLRQYRGESGCSLTSWIRMITVRTVIDHLRKKGVDAIGWQKRRIPLEALPELRAHEGTSHTEDDDTERQRMVEDGMQRLAPRDRLFLKLHFEQGLAIKEVAETMQLSVGNAYTLKHRAIQRLKLNVFSAENDEP